MDITLYLLQLIQYQHQQSHYFQVQYIEIQIIYSDETDCLDKASSF